MLLSVELSDLALVFVKLRSRPRSGEGQVRVRKVKERFGPELYPLFGFHPTTHPPSTGNYFLASEGV